MRVHVDGAYGGFFAILAGDPASADALGIDPAPWQAIASCDSFVVDPHKHGLQPYGCGAVVFADPDVARHYTHDSPYTYFTGGGAAHLGEISLECSRAGAAAAALWLTLRMFPLSPAGLGRVLSSTRRAARAFASRVEASDVLRLYQQGELDIVTYFPAGNASLDDVDAASERVLAEAMCGSNDPVFVSVLRVTAGELARRHGRLIPPAEVAGSGRRRRGRPRAALGPHEARVGTRHGRDLSRQPGGGRTVRVGRDLTLGMRVVVTPEAREFISARGTAYVSPLRRQCCGGALTVLAATTVAPKRCRALRTGGRWRLGVRYLRPAAARRRGVWRLGWHGGDAAVGGSAGGPGDGRTSRT